jgi:AAA+ superfamily predicted ATPase
VSSSVDRYSNMNINVLLQLIEWYEGVTVLTTNLGRSIDPAFERRIGFKITFELPQRAEREKLWRYFLPDDVPTQAQIDYERLSRIELTGAEIKNAVIRGAYGAAEAGALLDVECLVTTARQEAAAAGRLVRE